MGRKARLCFLLILSLLSLSGCSGQSSPELNIPSEQSPITPPVIPDQPSTIPLPTPDQPPVTPPASPAQFPVIPSVVPDKPYVIPAAASPGDVIKTISFPEGISGVSDIVFDKSSQSLLIFVYDIATKWEVTKIMQIPIVSGIVLAEVNINNPDFFMNHASSFTKNDNYFYGTSYGYSNGVPQSLIYKIDFTGKVIGSFPCPSTNMDGFCKGVAWDGQYLWCGGSNNINLTKFSMDGLFIKEIGALDSVNNRVEAYDPEANQLIVSTDNHLRLIDIITGAEVRSVYTGYSRIGDWDGKLFWAVNRDTRQFEGIYIGK